MWIIKMFFNCFFYGFARLVRRLFPFVFIGALLLTLRPASTPAFAVDPHIITPASGATNVSCTPDFTISDEGQGYSLINIFSPIPSQWQQLTNNPLVNAPDLVIPYPDSSIQDHNAGSDEAIAHHLTAYTQYLLYTQSDISGASATYFTTGTCVSPTPTPTPTPTSTPTPTPTPSPTPAPWVNVLNFPTPTPTPTPTYSAQSGEATITWTDYLDTSGAAMGGSVCTGAQPHDIKILVKNYSSTVEFLTFNSTVSDNYTSFLNSINASFTGGTIYPLSLRQAGIPYQWCPSHVIVLTNLTIHAHDTVSDLYFDISPVLNKGDFSSTSTASISASFKPFKVPLYCSDLDLLCKFEQFLGNGLNFLFGFDSIQADEQISGLTTMASGHVPFAYILMLSDLSFPSFGSPSGIPAFNYSFTPRLKVGGIMTSLTPITASISGSAFSDLQPTITFVRGFFKLLIYVGIVGFIIQMVIHL